MYRDAQGVRIQSFPYEPSDRLYAKHLTSNLINLVGMDTKELASANSDVDNLRACLHAVPLASVSLFPPVAVMDAKYC